MASKKTKNTIQRKSSSASTKAVKGKTQVKAKAVAKDSAKGGPSQWWTASVQFLREVKTELKKVTWPSRRQTISSTGVVVVLVVIVSAFLGLVDMILARLVRLVIG